MFGTDLHPDSQLSERDIFTGEIDEIFIIEGSLDQAAILQLMQNNRLHP